MFSLSESLTIRSEVIADNTSTDLSLSVLDSDSVSVSMSGERSDSDKVLHEDSVSITRADKQAAQIRPTFAPE